MEEIEVVGVLLVANEASETLRRRDDVKGTAHAPPKGDGSNHGEVIRHLAKNQIL